jgi:hypothetical protein
MTVISNILYFFHGQSSAGRYVFFLHIICTAHEFIAIEYTRERKHSWQAQVMLLNLNLQVIRVLAVNRGERNLVLPKTIARFCAKWTATLLEHNKHFYIYTYKMWIITLLHILVLAWALIAPITKTLRVSYVLLMPVLMLHWLLLDDTCALTLLENHLRGCDTKESFVHQFVSKIYNVPDGILGSLTWVYAIATWLYAISKVTREDFREAF